MAPSGGGELGAGVGATPFGLLVEGSRYLCFAGGAVGEASGSGRCRVVVRGGGFFPFRVWWTGELGLCYQRRIARGWARGGAGCATCSIFAREGLGEMRPEMRYLAMIMGGDCGGAAVGWRTNWGVRFWKV